jgi:hypothetical protein
MIYSVLWKHNNPSVRKPPTFQTFVGLSANWEWVSCTCSGKSNNRGLASAILPETGYALILMGYAQPESGNRHCLSGLPRCHPSLLQDYVPRIRTVVDRTVPCADYGKRATNPKRIEDKRGEFG